MQPRPDIGWQAVTIDAHVHGPFAAPDAAGRLRIDALTAAGVRIDQVTADIAGNAGQLRLNGEVTGLHVPGPNAELLAGDPLTITADARLDAPDRPVHVALRHRLFTADADALTGERRSVDASLRLADLAPFAAMGQVPLQGSLALTLHAAIDGDTTTLAADGTMAVTGGQPQASALVGDDGRISLAATLHGSDLTLSRLRVLGPCRHTGGQRAGRGEPCRSGVVAGGQRSRRRRTATGRRATGHRNDRRRDRRSHHDGGHRRQRGGARHVVRRARRSGSTPVGCRRMPAAGSRRMAICSTLRSISR